MTIGGIGSGNIPPSGGSGPTPPGGPGGDGPKKTGSPKRTERDEFVPTPDSEKLEWLHFMASMYDPANRDRFIATPEAAFTSLIASQEITESERSAARILYEQWKVRSKIRHGTGPIEPVPPIGRIGDREPNPEFPESPHDEEKPENEKPKP